MLYLFSCVASMASLEVPLALQLVWCSRSFHNFISALVGRAPEASPWFVRRRGVIIDVPEGAAAGSRAIVSLPDDGYARHATVTIAFPPGLSTGQELTVALEV